MSVITEFYSGLLDKGYTEREIRESCKRHQERVAPDWFDGTYKEYIESMHDFLNGIWSRFLLPMRGSWIFLKLFQFVTIGIEWVAACV